MRLTFPFATLLRNIVVMISHGGAFVNTVFGRMGKENNWNLQGRAEFLLSAPPRSQSQSMGMEIMPQRVGLWFIFP